MQDLKRLFTYFGKYKKDIVIGGLLVVCESFFELLIPVLMADLIDTGVMQKDMSYIFYKGAQMGVCALLSLITGLLYARFAARAAYGFGANVRDAQYTRIQEYAFSNLDRFETSSLVTRMTTDVTTIQNMYQMLLRIFFRAPMQFVFALVLSFRINHEVSSVFFYVIPLILVTLAIFAPVAYKRFKRMFKMFDGLNASVQENLIAIRVVKAFVRGDYEKKKFKKANDDLMAAAISAEKLMVLAQPMMMLVLFGTILTIAFLSSKFIVAGQMEIGNFAAILTYVMQILFSVIMIAMIFVSYVMSRASVSRIEEVLDEVPDK